MPINHFEAQRFGRLELLAKQAVEGFITGLHKSPFHGFSVEFAEHRAYNNGESTKHIDWKLYGRTDKLFVKRYEEETNLRCQMVVDTSASMFYPKTKNAEDLNKLQFAIQASAALIYLMRSQRDAAGITLFGEKVNLHTPAKSSNSHLNYLFYELEKQYDAEAGDSNTNLVSTLHELAEKMPRRSMIIIFTDFMDSSMRGTESDRSGLFQALQHLKYNKHEVIIFHLADKATEVDFDLENRPYTLVDMETGEKVKLLPHQVREAYKAQREKINEEIKLKCRQFRIDWIETDIQEGVIKVLDRFLAKRSKLG